ILSVVDRAAWFLWQAAEIQRRNPEHGPCALAVRRRDDGRVHIQEPTLSEEVVNGKRERIADSEHGPEGVRSGAKVRDIAQELHGVPLLLQGVRGRIGAS